MKSPRQTAVADAVAPAPSVYEHSRQPQWGRAVLTATQTDRATYVFEHAGERTFMNGYSSIVEVELAPEEREALAKRLLRGHASATRAAKKRRTSTTTKPKKTTTAKASATKKAATKAEKPAEPPAEEEAGSSDADE